MHAVCPTKVHHNICRLSFILVCTLLIAGATAAWAADEKSLGERFEFHGFLTQAYATSSFSDLGPTPQEVILGIPEDGTSDYRFLALQFRYEISPKDIVVVQLSSRSLGESPINDVEDDIELDWAFYEHRLTPDTSVKVGRIQIPFGIFNEIRDVGTILPFYRPPFNFYNEGSFTSETVDGLLFHHTFFSASDWPLDFDVYYGEFELVEQAVFDPTEEPAIATAKDSWGVQLWLNTPWSGLRVGVGTQRRSVFGGQEGIFRPVGEDTDFEDNYASLELMADKFVFRTEYRENKAPLESPAFGFSIDNSQDTFYAQLGYYFTEKLHAYVQYEDSVVVQSSPVFTVDEDTVNLAQDLGFALNYHFSPNLVLKLEYHEIDQEIPTFVPVFTPGGFAIQPVNIPSDNGSYSIATLAVSF